MNILVLAPQPFFQNRGTPIATLKLLRVLAAQGHELDVLTYHEGTDIAIERCTIHRITAPSWVLGIGPGFSWKKLVCDLFMLFTCLRMARSGRWQLVHAIEESVFMALLVKYCWGIPYVYDMDSSLPAQLVEKYSLLRPLLPLLRACESLAVRSARGVIAVCQTLEDGARSYEPASPVVRVEDASLLETDADAAEVVHRGIGAAGSLIVYVGNLEHYQGIDLLLEAFVHVYRRDADAQLVIVGGAEPDIQHYERRSCELGIAARTHFIGSRALRRLGRYLSLADILVSPRTKGNNTPMKIYSYMDAGKPIVATRLPTHTQVLDEEIACLTDPLPAAFADGILSLLSDRARSAALGAGARERSRRQYSPAALDFKLASFYRDVAMAVAN